jgi:hypothetical protein
MWGVLLIYHLYLSFSLILDTLWEIFRYMKRSTLMAIHRLKFVNRQVCHGSLNKQGDWGGKKKESFPR